MSIQGPTPYDPLYRVQPVDKDREDEGKQEQRRRRVQYQGRAWAESEEGLPLQPNLPETSVAQDETPQFGTFANKRLLERAHALFAQFSTLEEKVAQLCFITADASYSPDSQELVEWLIQVWQVGGLLFTQGTYKRQSYLIERFQELAKTQLLIGNDFIQGLSFYFQGELPETMFQEKITEQRFLDLGKAVMAQNRRIGIHFQFDRERGSGKKLAMTAEQARAFCKGIRYAGGFIGREKQKEQPTAKSPGLGSALTEQQVQETIGIRMLHFYDLENNNLTTEGLKQALSGQHDALIVDAKQAAATIKMLCSQVRAGEIQESEIDRHVMRILMTKLSRP